MLVDYFYWQYVWAPKIFLQILWNLERALWRFFSVKFMLRTLLAHWHKDAIPYRGGTLSNLALTFIWNQVSRFIGFLIRSAVLLAWLIAEIIFMPLAATIFLVFLVWPLVVLTSLSVGLALLSSIF